MKPTRRSSLDLVNSFLDFVYCNLFEDQVRRLAIATTLTFLTTFSSAWAWGNEGHEVIALIAADRLSPTAKNQIEILLGGDARQSMARASIWADQIRRHRPKTAPWHYIDIEISSSGYTSNNCPKNDCVTAQIQKDVSIVRDKSVAPPIRAEALRFLIHFVGDVHQPLHAADNNDRGGNEIQMMLNRRRKNLHSVWDADLVKSLGNDPNVIATALEGEITPAKARQWTQGSPIDWTNESFRIAKSKIYIRFAFMNCTDTPIILPLDYSAQSSEIVRLQLERAGVRLAATLNHLLSTSARQSE